MRKACGAYAPVGATWTGRAARILFGLAIVICLPWLLGRPNGGKDPELFRHIIAEGAGDASTEAAVEDEARAPREAAVGGQVRTPILADYDKELREGSARSDGHVHVISPLLVERLVALNVNTYAFLIGHDTEDWDDLKEYLPLAEAAGLTTWVYLLPPSEMPGQYPPYEGDYVAWGRAIGQLAASYPSLTAFAMDDFNLNLSTFTVENTCAMLQAAREGRPDIKFYAVDYFPYVLGDFRLNDFRGCIQGVIFPYTDLDSNTGMREQIETIAGLREAGTTMRISFPKNTASSSGDYSRYSFSCVPESTTGRVSFYYGDSYSGPTAGYHIARVRYGDTTLWSEDVGGSESPARHTLDFSPVTGTPLVFEVYDELGVYNYGVDVEFSAIAVEGCGDSGLSQWIPASNNPAFSATVSQTLAYPGLEIIPMIYAEGTSWHRDPPTTEIIREAVSIALQTWQEGISQGAITYCLTKNPVTDPDYVAVQTLYGAVKPADIFADVPFSHPYHDDIEALYRAGYTAGCNSDPLMYCPENTMNRAESSVFVERGIHSAAYDPPPPATQVFADLPLDSWAAKWVNGLWEDGYTAGCGTSPLIYCPWQGHTRAEGCVFYLRMMNGANYEPPQPAQQTFVDVPLDAWYAGWVQAGYDAGLLEPCRTAPELRFCPSDPLTRALAAHMMVRAKSLALP